MSSDAGTNFSNDGSAILEQITVAHFLETPIVDLARVYDLKRCADEILARGFKRVGYAQRGKEIYIRKYYLYFIIYKFCFLYVHLHNFILV